VKIGRNQAIIYINKVEIEFVVVPNEFFSGPITFQYKNEPHFHRNRVNKLSNARNEGEIWLILLEAVKF